ncbi:rna-binding protein rnp24 [Acrodontium crateriforme]|uniref:Rna-binding protein rnp24 n=1 Tax=Acrodontium crateriforme TaxID=150365 RepID=A0AAQ3M575_9PEZI|nr:rna-binding protein rnp24 [Acrodontium crateriforme]
MSKEQASNSAESSPEPVMSAEKKRKRTKVAPEEELEIDINLPEPPSKKAKRAEKKKKEKSKTAKSIDETGEDGVAIPKEKSAPVEANTAVEPSKRSEYGIWIGNLPFSATKDSLRTFLLDHGNIDEKDITRLHMPGPATKGPDRPGPKPQNRGFAYIDFTTQEILDAALALSEKLLVGRRVLIKNAKSFEGRPDKTKVDPATEGTDAAAPVRKEATKRIFVGNLSFDVTQEELHEHFQQAGEIEEVHMATFEDSGKCKGFAWVRFVEVESAEAAVRGFVFKDMNNGDDEDEESDDKDASDSDEAESKAPSKKKKKEKKRKWFINRLHARPLRCEFAEDAQTRYKKRFGKDAAGGRNGARRDAPFVPGGNDAENVDFGGDAADGQRRPRLDKDQRQAERRAKHDARKIAPGKANANAQRATGAIVEAKGTKVTFD